MREATIHLDSEPLAAVGIEAFVSSVQAAGLEQVTELQCQRPGCLLVAAAAQPLDDALALLAHLVETAQPAGEMDPPTPSAGDRRG